MLVYNALPGSYEIVKLIYDNVRQLILPQDTRSKAVKALAYGALAVIPKILSKENACGKNAHLDVKARVDHAA